jgi:hypothetical protein
MGATLCRGQLRKVVSMVSATTRACREPLRRRSDNVATGTPKAFACTPHEPPPMRRPSAACRRQDL